MCRAVNGVQVCASNCSQTRCNSPGSEASWPGPSGDDCWAGGRIEKCTCSSGKPFLLGNSRTYGLWDRVEKIKSEIEYEYTCCETGAGFADEACGDCCYYGPLFLNNLIYWTCFFTLWSAFWTMLYYGGAFRPPADSSDKELWLACFEGREDRVRELVTQTECVVDVNYSDGAWYDIRR